MYTKGKWKVIPTGLSGVWKFRIETNKNIMAAVYSEANAHLIAKSPRMYEALKRLLDCGTQHEVDRLLGVGFLDEVRNILD